LALAIVFIAACGTGDAGTKSRHALVIGFDGVRVDALARASTPRIDEHPHFFAHVREKDPGAYPASFATWAPINESIASSAHVDVVFSSTMPTDSAAGDIAVTAAVVAHVASGTHPSAPRSRRGLATRRFRRR